MGIVPCLPIEDPSEIDRLPPLSGLWVFEDGRLIWQKFEDLAEGANARSTGLLEQRLTPEGVELMRSDGLAAIRSGKGAPQCDQLDRPYVLSYGTGMAAFSADAEHLARVMDPWSWLPATAWEDREIRAYVPSTYQVVFGRFRDDSSADRHFPRDDLAAQLPAAAMDLIDTKLWRNDQGFNFATFTTDEARALAAALEDARLEQDGLLNAYQLDYQFEYHGDPPAKARDSVVHIRFVSDFRVECSSLPLCLPFP